MNDKGMNFNANRAEDLWGKAKKDPDWHMELNVEGVPTGRLVHRNGRAHLRRDPIKGWVGT
jgi:hypothetical protein